MRKMSVLVERETGKHHPVDKKRSNEPPESMLLIYKMSIRYTDTHARQIQDQPSRSQP